MGLHIPYLQPGGNLCDLGTPPTVPHPYCYFRPKEMLGLGRLDYVETGTNPIYRWQWVGQDARCFDKDRLPGGWAAFNGPLVTKPLSGAQGGHEALLSDESRAVVTALARGDAVEGLNPKTLQGIADNCDFTQADP